MTLSEAMSFFRIPMILSDQTWYHWEAGRYRGYWELRQGVEGS